MLKGRKKAYLGIVAVAVVGAGVAGLYLDSRQPQTDIKDHTIGQRSLSGGHVTSGKDTASGNAIATKTHLTYESPELATGLPKANAIGLNWTQAGDGDAHVEVRTNDGDGWSDWSELPSDDKPDFSKPSEHGAILLTANARQAQYRFALHGKVKVSGLKVSAVDATTGPDPTKKSLISKVFSSKASATSAPTVISRSGWGIPAEANGTPRWTPRYYKLQRAMVHHTVTNASTSKSSSAATVRAIWDLHANQWNWGDIGYNYLVDVGGHIFQGRYYDKSFAQANKVEVEAGHTYSFNDRSIGVAALGDFRTDGAVTALRENIAKIIGYKFAPFKLGAKAMYSDEGVSPGSASGCYPARGSRSQWRIAGHRNYCSTECPGDNLYGVLGAIRNRAQAYRDAYVLQSGWDYSFAGAKSTYNPHLGPGQTTDLYIDLKNEGNSTWHNTGSVVVRLGTSHPRDRRSRFSATWLAPNRTGTFDDQSGGGDDGDVHTVQTGETARFSFTATAPSTTGTYKEYFQPVADGSAWFARDIAINWLLTVRSGYGYSFVSKSATPSAITPGVTSQDVSVVLKNTGTESWPVDGKVRLGTDQARDHKSAFATFSGADPWLSRNRPSSVDAVTDADGNTLGGESVVDPGQYGRFDFTITVPDSLAAGSYRLYVRPVADGVGWLSASNIYFPVTVASQRALDFEKTVYEHSQFNFSRGSSMYARVAIKNMGRVSWPVSGSHPVRLATTHPRDRNSAFYTGSGSDPWLSHNRASAIDGKVLDLASDLDPADSGKVDTTVTEIDPGETALFVVNLTANKPVGTYREFFSLVQEGAAWFPDPGYNMYLKVVSP